MRRTKILATLGPASADPDVLDAMIAAGADGIRLNFSHGDWEWHSRAASLVREAAVRAGRYIAILEDLQGPKIRVGPVAGDGMQLAAGSRLIITSRPVEGSGEIVSTEYPDLARDVAPGNRLLLDDGKITLRVVEVRDGDVICEVQNEGVLTSHKGINVPDAALSAPAMTRKDREDALFALSLGVDYLALSFVRRAADVLELRALLKEESRPIPVIAKIEKPQAIDNLDEILEAADGVMVARGDLGVEVSLEMIPAFQKRIIRAANRRAKLVITATQMLETMTENPFPTRAEVTDVANAILDGTDVVMLSGETAIGRHPVETVRRMAAIAETTEEKLYPFSQPVSEDRKADSGIEGEFTPVIARLAGVASQEVEPKAIVIFTRRGRMARAMSYERPRAPVLGFTVDETVLRRLALCWGIVPQPIKEMDSSEDLLSVGERLVLKGGWAKPGDPVLFLFGTRTTSGATNSIRIARVGDLSARSG